MPLYLGSGQPPLIRPIFRSARVATTANITNLASGAPLVVDGVTLAANDIVLVHKQTNGAENGPYRVVTPGTGADGAWERAPGFKTGESVPPGLHYYISEGSTYARTPFDLVTSGNIILGTTSLDFLPGRLKVRSDTVETEIKASGAFSTTYAFSNTIDMIDYDDVDIYVEVTNKGTNTSMSVKAQSTGEATPTNWSDVLADDDIVDGLTTPATYEATFDITSEVATFRKHLNFPKRGTTMRIGVKGTAADGAFSVKAVRNVRGG